MKIGFLSDLHIDFYSEKELNNFIDKITNKKLDSLIIAGDIGHYNEDICYFFEKIILKNKNINIFFTYGNHELYLLENKYLDSIDKIFSLNKKLKKFDIFKNVYFMDYVKNNTIEIDNIKISGFSGWYDFSYSFKLLKNEKIKQIFINKMNLIMDLKIKNLINNGYIKNKEFKEYLYILLYYLYSNNDLKYIYIKGLENFNNKIINEIKNLNIFNDKEIYKVKIFEYLKETNYEQFINILKQKPDIIFSHIAPNSNRIVKMYVNEISSGFYFFDGLNDILKINPELKYYFFGHIHNDYNYKVNNINFFSNPLGYKREKRKFKIKIREINK